MASSDELTWRDLEVGGIVTQPGSTAEYETGTWRSERPVLDEEKCNQCGLCYIYCPDASIDFDNDTYPKVNLFSCKGCGICAVECPKEAITMVEEEE